MPSTTPEELSSILGRLLDAKCVLETAVQIMEAGDYPPEVVTARQGMKMLHAAYDDLDSAICRYRVAEDRR